MNVSEYWALSIGLVGGLALFLLGMDFLTRALKQVAGGQMRSLLSRVAGNRIKGLATGAFVTAIIQSSSVTTVLLVGLVSAGLMTTAQAIPIILGANIGTTITAQMLAFKVSAIALPVLSVGFFVSFLASSKRVREYGRILLGLGLLFFGMGMMGDALQPLRNSQSFVEFMLTLQNPVLAVLVGAGFTALVQSSSATTGILIVLLGHGLLSLDAAIAIALGANIGTCITALIAGAGKPVEAKRAAWAHTIFNIAGVILWIGFIDELATLARLTTPYIPGASSIHQSEAPRQLANIHTIFNTINALIFILFVPQLDKAITLLIPDRPHKPDPKFAPRHLDPKLVEVPDFALDAVRLELLRLGNFTLQILRAARPASISGSPVDLDRVRVMDRPIDLLQREIIAYLRQVSLGRMTAEQSTNLMALARIANDFEHIGDVVATGIITSAEKRIDENVTISPVTGEVISGLFSEVIETLEQCLAALEKRDRAIAEALRARDTSFSKLVESIAAHEIERLRADRPKRMQTYTREIELTESLDDIFKIIRRIARTLMRIYPPVAERAE